MKTQTLAAMAVLLAGSWATSALADVTVVADIDKTKSVTVTETVFIDKFVFVDVDVDRDLGQAAQAMAIANVRNELNRVDRNTDVFDNLNPATAETDDGHLEKNATIGNSINGNTGGGGVNQDDGNMVNQANLAAVGITSGDDETVANAQAMVDQDNNFNDVFLGSFNPEVIDPADDNTITLTATISGSVNNNIGVFGVNQNGGNMNNQTNAVAVAAGLGGLAGGAISIAEADLGQENTNNEVVEFDVSKNATISGSVNGNQGIVGVNQALGNNGNQGIVVAVGAAILD